MLSESVVAQLSQAADDAEIMAVLGQVAGGFLLLAAAQRRAQAAQDTDEVWRQEAARRYQEVMDAYAERHRLKTTGAGPSLWQTPQSGGIVAPEEDDPG